MTIILLSTVQQRVWGGGPNARDPIGMWHGGTAQTGDATGGSNVIDFVFQAQGAQAIDPNIYSLEQLSIQKDDALLENIRVRSVVMGDLSGVDGWLVQVGVAGAQGFSAGFGSHMAFLPVFLSDSLTIGSTTSLEIAANNVDTVNLIVSAQGYIWGSRSRSTPGGPRRPSDGLYGH